ncbi:MAG: (2Fe-2S)-binding protein [Hydrogenophilales bacterium RIFOXYD1_FULL_62_11]|nr:MAG: (2Fe-2S)-binding protein [Hydrogenophilales bacterium RIFOXYD1_FULL_62_11]
MYVCLCHNVTDNDIRHLVRTEGVSSMRELRNQLGVATQCGKCAQCARQVLNEALADMSADACCPSMMAAA